TKKMKCPGKKSSRLARPWAERNGTSWNTRRTFTRRSRASRKRSKTCAAWASAELYCDVGTVSRIHNASHGAMPRFLDKLVVRIEWWLLKKSEVARFDDIGLVDLRRQRNSSFPAIIECSLRLIKEHD